jgi:hypothetical protein
MTVPTAIQTEHKLSALPRQRTDAVQQAAPYSITSAARANSVGGTAIRAITKRYIRSIASRA